MDHRPCENCDRVIEIPYLNGFCSPGCQKEYDLRAARAGGYHVLARDREILRLKKELVAKDGLIRALTEELHKAMGPAALELFSMERASA